MKTIIRMYKHLNWANQRMLEILQTLECDNQQARRLFSHILYSEQVWLSRLQGIDSSHLPIWGEIEITACEALVKQNEQSFTIFLSSIIDSDLDNLITYRNSEGKEFRSSLRDILTHLVLHGQYHRGQIMSRLRADGIDPINIDFITFVR
ncbi:DinB family protein [Bacillus solitudinis]|uniref:DinB family protein n=1 Tax=Bacillus solitudinis TaxID=2014074 RepID=UPI000C239A46|nr:DinB family protein [Bacillus solitudinis]